MQNRSILRKFLAQEWPACQYSTGLPFATLGNTHPFEAGSLESYLVSQIPQLKE